MNEVMQNPFSFSEQEVRTAVDEHGTVFFCAKDVFEALDVKWSGNKKSLINIPETWKGVLYLQTPGGVQEAIFVSEPGVYRLIFRSSKPKAVEFANWVCEEVLPSIRKQGFFGKVDARNRLSYSKQISTLAEKLSNTKDAFVHKLLVAEMRNLCNMIGQPMPDLSLIGQDYKQLTLTGIE